MDLKKQQGKAGKENRNPGRNDFSRNKEVEKAGKTSQEKPVEDHKLPGTSVIYRPFMEKVKEVEKW